MTRISKYMAVRRCGSKGCQEPRAPGRYVCATHAVEMDRIRVEFETATRNKMHRWKRPPTCCAAGCYEPRERSKAFCDAHRDNVQETD